MLIKRNTLMTSKARAVKNTAFALIISACAISMSPAAAAGEPVWTQNVVTVKFSAAELKAENGLDSVYTKLEKKAKRFCISDKVTSEYLGESMADCVSDLMDQFVADANIDSLQAYHLSFKAERTQAG